MSQPTITIKIAAAGTNLLDETKSSLGHMWYEINDGNGNKYSFGFAPIAHGQAFTQGKVYTDDSLNYLETADSKTINITTEQFNALLNFGSSPSSAGFNFSTYYNGLSNSCIDFTWKALQISGIIPLGSFEGDLLPTWNIDEVNTLGANFINSAIALAQNNYHDALNITDLNNGIVNGNDVFVWVPQSYNSELNITSPAVLFDVTKDPATGEPFYRPIAYPTPNQEADNPSQSIGYIKTFGDHANESDLVSGFPAKVEKIVYGENTYTGIQGSSLTAAFSNHMGDASSLILSGVNQIASAANGMVYALANSSVGIPKRRWWHLSGNRWQPGWHGK